MGPIKKVSANPMWSQKRSKPPKLWGKFSPSASSIL